MSWRFERRVRTWHPITVSNGRDELRGFVMDTRTQYAVICNPEIVGKATENLSADMRKGHLDLPWGGMAGRRGGLIHDCFGINLDVVWQMITDELPEAVARRQAIAGERQ